MRLRDMAARTGARGGLDWMKKKDWLGFGSMRIWSSDIKVFALTLNDFSSVSCLLGLKEGRKEKKKTRSGSILNSLCR